MHRKSLPVLRQLRNLSTKKKLNPKFNFDVDVDVASGLKDGSLKVRRHPGMFGISHVSLPEPLMQAVEVVLQDYPWKSLWSASQGLSRYIWSRHAPLEREEVMLKQNQIQQRVSEKEFIDLQSPDKTEEERRRLLDSLQSKVHQRMKKEMYNWKAIQYDPYICATYIAARLAPDFAALVRIMSEIKKRDPGFTPLTMLDFGSGVGSGMWALDTVWPGMCREVVCVDISADMNNLADKLLRQGDPDKPRLVRDGGTFFKQFLPLSNLLKYDLVISSRSLFELPTMNTRLRTLDVLWRKTSGYLVLVEAGTNAGYRIVQEARDYLLELSRQAREEGESNPEGYIFAPCPHDKFCPKFFDGTNIPCNFEISYKPLSLDRNLTPQKDVFTYVVLKRGRREESAEKHWPRLVESPMPRKKHVVCRMCTPFGTLVELTATKRKHTPDCNRLLRYSKCGDLLPVEVPEVPEDPKDDSSVEDEDNNELSDSQECIQK